MKASKIGLLTIRQWQENKRAYYIGMLTLAGIIAFFFMLTWHFRNSFSGDTHKGIFLIGLFIGGSLFSSSLLKDIAQPSRAVWLLGLPASTGEKLFVALLYCALAYILAFLAIYFLNETIFRLIAGYNTLSMQFRDLFKNGFYNFFFTFINYQIIILYGSLFFKRAAFLKSVLLILIFFALTNSLNNEVLRWMTGEATINGGGLFDYFQFVHKGENVYVYLPNGLDIFLTVFFHFLLPVILYYITYLKFKETEL